MIKLSDLFHIEYGNQADLNKLEEVSSINGIRFISRSSENLGFQCYVKRDEKMKIYNKGDITVTLGGTYLLSAFVQPDNFYTGQNIKVLTPKMKMSDAEKYFYCYAIAQNRFRYTSHGREANKTLDDLPVPSLNELPKWINTAIYKVKKPTKKPFHNKNVDLNDRNWDWVNLIDYFKMYAGKYYSNDSFSKGKTPLVTSSDNNNGIMIYTDIKPKYKNCITIGKVGCSAFYQKDYFVASPDVTVLEPNFIMNQFHALFIVTLLNKEKFKWSYGRQIRLNDSKKLRLKMPITNEGIPDWDFIEYFMKSLPYSSNIKEQKKSSNDGLSDEELIEKYESGAIDLGEKIKKTIGKT
jgi:hypothetical protein